jgi:hypothetical protein
MWEPLQRRKANGAVKLQRQSPMNRLPQGLSRRDGAKHFIDEGA